MRSLDAIFNHGNGTRTIVFEEGKWCIYRKADDKEYVIHRCSRVIYAIDDDGESGWICGSNGAARIDQPTGCGEKMPDSIKTLYILYRWNR